MSDADFSEKTQVRLTLHHLWLLITIVAGSAASCCALYYGISAEIQKVNAQLAEIQWHLRENISREEFRDWIDDFRSQNKAISVPPPPPHQT